MGTMLQRAGLPLGAAPEAWNRERPEAVLAVHAAYRAAGAEWLQTNSFGGNRFRLEAVGLGGADTAVNAAAVRLAREAAGGDGPLVVGSLGSDRAPAGAAGGAPDSGVRSGRHALP